jgi:hypothetical protein
MRLTAIYKTRKLCQAIVCAPGWLENGAEGYSCTLPTGHKGPHRDESCSPMEDTQGRVFYQVTEWTWKARKSELYHNEKMMKRETW